MTRPNQSNILLGRADIRIDDYSNYISDIRPSLNHSDHSLGQAQDCTLENIREFETMYKLNSAMPIGKYLTEFGIGLTATILNAGISMFALLFGYDPNYYNATYYSYKQFPLTPNNFTQSNIYKWRIEAEFIYPDNKNKMTVILPKTTLINPSDPSLVNLDSPDGISLKFDQEEMTNSSWIGSEMGIIVFGTTES